MIAAFVDDLLFRSKIKAAASRTGTAVSFLREASHPSLEGAAMVIIDLDGHQAIETIAALHASWPDLRIVGFVSHVHAERIRDARAAGATDVMARSAFVNTLPALLSGAADQARS